MNVAEQILAGLALAACVVLLVRLALGDARRARLDAAVARQWYGWRAWWRTTVRRTGSRRDPVKEKARVARAAAREASAAIRRAQSQARDSVRRGDGVRPRPEADVDGNVIHPRAFRRPGDSAGHGDGAGTHRGNDTLH